MTLKLLLFKLFIELLDNYFFFVRLQLRGLVGPSALVPLVGAAGLLEATTGLRSRAIVAAGSSTVTARGVRDAARLGSCLKSLGRAQRNE
jgi:hypothetical protein